MKTLKPMLFAAMLTAAMPLLAHAEYTGPGSQPQAVLMSAKDALKAADDTPLILEGHLVRHLDQDHYLFRDASGEVRVEIERKQMPVAKFDANTRLRLRGEVERELGGRDEIDIKQVEILP